MCIYKCKCYICISIYIILICIDIYIYLFSITTGYYEYHKQYLVNVINNNKFVTFPSYYA